MKGLELAHAHYEVYGKPMLEEKFPHLLPKIAGYAYSINDLIRDSNLRNLHILFGV